MARPKSTNFETKIKNDEFILRIKNAIWTTTAFHFSPDYALRYINSGLLGFQTNKDGTQKIDQTTGKAMPITISRATFFRYKKEFINLPQVYEDLQRFALEGYVKMLWGFMEELKFLHQLSAENLLSLKEPLERQHIIDSMVKHVIPTQSAFADILKHMIDAGMLVDLRKENDANWNSNGSNQV